MVNLFLPFNHRALDSSFPYVEIDGDRVEYLAFSKPEKSHLPPILILPGVFQDFRSLILTARRLLQQRPVLLAALPDQGSNPQSAPHRTFNELADLLALFLDRLGIAQVLPLAFSYGAALGYTFSSLYPRRTERVVLGGIFHRMNESFRSFLIEARGLLESEEMAKFADLLCSNMINQSARSITGVTEEFQLSFRRYLENLPLLDRKRYIHNIDRLIHMDALPGKPEVPGLLYVGRQDHYTPPESVRETAQKFDQALFVLIEGGDHLVATERKTTLDLLFQAYISHGDPGSIPGITLESIR